jgi:hypothetical protein
MYMHPLSVVENISPLGVTKKATRLIRKRMCLYDPSQFIDPSLRKAPPTRPRANEPSTTAIHPQFIQSSPTKEVARLFPVVSNVPAPKISLVST